ncbi:PadR family transcriptional regulator [Bradyrhizobium sp. WYCCWR 13023]|uniref:PadR family transcriptional regulator n=1 Tax=Bradyrhizobium zhengyangense TaxID=2911009 RepID=A0A9X1R687_9BRAD|nr:PadR family transcriptional regulator [Bradyrhizobium zhengyangense]MCG2627004.1 PadR family transcriptional regulator [Bradyrhizobium zhengyangense]
MFGKHRDHRDFHFGHLAHFAMGRHGGRHRFGRGGHGFFGRGGNDFPGARRLSSQDLQLVILALLADRPAHGYELIKIIEERSEGFYTPSPGVIYPALTYLEEVGHASVAQDGGRKLYSITPQGEAFLAEQRGTADAILQALSRIGRRMDEVREAFAGVSDLDADASDELHRARHNLKRALRSKHGSDPAEARRIAGILERAAAEILGR